MENDFAKNCNLFFFFILPKDFIVVVITLKSDFKQILDKYNINIHKFLTYFVF